MAERSFKAEVEHLRKGDGDVFTGEGILAITKALLENGVGYVGGYQGAPISHLMDVLADAEELMGELGVRFVANASEAAAAAMLGWAYRIFDSSAVWRGNMLETGVAHDVALLIVGQFCSWKASSAATGGLHGVA